MDTKVTEAEMTILHLLAERPRYGYEIEEVIEARGMREWTAIGFSSIYYLLKKLEKGGRDKRRQLAESRLVEGGRGPARKVYGITPAGLGALREGALAALANAEGDSQSLLLGLSSLAVLEQEEVLSALLAHRQGLVARQERVAGQMAGQAPLPDFVTAMFDYSQTMLAARLEWLDGIVEKMESGRFSWPASEEQVDGEYEDRS